MKKEKKKKRNNIQHSMNFLNFYLLRLDLNFFFLLFIYLFLYINLTYISKIGLKLSTHIVKKNVFITIYLSLLKNELLKKKTV